MPYDPIIVKVKSDRTTAIVSPSGGVSFGVVNVTGQNNVVATKTTDILKVRQGTGISITTDSTNGSLTITATGGSAFDSIARDIANGAFEQANSAALRANTLVTDNVPETTTNLYFTAERVRSNISNTTPINYDSSNGIIIHANSGVTATTYGNTTFVPQITVDDHGHVISIVNTAIALPSGSDQFARDQANAAFDKSNSANVLAQTARDHANGAFSQSNSAALRANTLVTDNVPETTTNLYFTAARVRANISNTAPINYNPTSGVISHADSGIVAKTYGNNTLIPQLTVDARGHVTAITNVAITGLPSSTANGQLLIGNTVSGSFDVNTLTQGTGIVITNDKGSITIAASGGSSLDQFARDTANGAYAHANGAYTHANGAFTRANAATPNTATSNGQIYAGNTVSGQFDLTTIAQTAPVIVTNGRGTVTLSHASSGVIATTYGSATSVSQVTIDQFGHITSASNVAIDQSLAQSARDHANGAFTTANSAYAHANGSFAAANTKVANSGVTVNGSVLIGNTVSGGFDLRTIAQSSPVIVTNDRGSIVLSHARSGVVATGYGDATSIPVFVVDANGHITSVTNTAIAITTSQVTESAGGPFYHTAARVRGNVTNTAPINYDASTGTFSHAASGVTATGYGDAASIPVFVVNATGHVTSVTNTTIAIVASQITSGTLSIARGGTGQTAITVNGAILIANTVSGGYDVNRITQTAPVIVTNDKGSITLSHASSGVTATTYGNANHVSQITVDGFGHVTSSVNTRIGIGASQITSGATANGQLLIGNTVSGAFDVATLTQGTNITITNDKGSITIAASGGGGADQFARDQANAAYNKANGAYDHANGSFAAANTKVANSGVTVNGSLLIGNTVSGGFDLNTITQGSGITITNGQGTITISSSGGGGNSFGVINVASLNQSNVYAGAANDTLILAAGVGMNVTTNVVSEKVVQFQVNPGYLSAIASGHALYAL